MRRREPLAAVLAALLAIALCRAYGQENLTFSLPNSVLLFAHPYSRLLLVTTANVQELKPPAEEQQQRGLKFPSLASNGSYVAWGFVPRDKGDNHRRHFVLGVYSTTQQKWKTYGDFEDIGTSALSPSGSKVAFTAGEPAGSRSFLILHLSSGEMTQVAQLSSVPARASIGWSADEKQLVVEMERGDQPPVIAVYDPVTGDVKTIGEGTDPAWSPIGDWIAYFDEVRQKCFLVRPDGTDTRVIRDLGRRVLGYRMFYYGAIWSPDGKQLLLQEMKGEGPNVDVMLVDLASGKATRKAANGLPVFGWVSQKR
jgi:hypothetical protein